MELTNEVLDGHAAIQQFFCLHGPVEAVSLNRQQQLFEPTIRRRHMSPLNTASDLTTSSSLRPAATDLQRRLAARMKAAETLTVPMDWLRRAAWLPGKSLHVAIAILDQARWAQGREVVLDRRAITALGISRDACYDALGRLEAAQLIVTRRGRGVHPAIQILASSR